MSDFREIVDIGLEGALVILILIIARKVQLMKCDTHSSCFKEAGNGITMETHNDEKV